MSTSMSIYDNFAATDAARKGGLAKATKAAKASKVAKGAFKPALLTTDNAFSSSFSHSMSMSHSMDTGNYIYNKIR